MTRQDRNCTHLAGQSLRRRRPRKGCGNRPICLILRYADYMKTGPILLGAMLLLGATRASAADWQWIKVTDNVAYGWQTELGSAAVTIQGTTFKATLYWATGDAGQERITLSGTIRKGAITATETIWGTDAESTKFTGTYKKVMWDEPFERAIGEEVINLSSGHSMIGIRRN